MRTLLGLSLALGLLRCRESEAASTQRRSVFAPANSIVPEPRIVGGVVAPNKTWIASLGTENEEDGYLSACTGSLIAPKWVLTAAHCFDVDPDSNAEPPNLVYVAGQDLRKLNTFKKARIAEVFQHPQWDPAVNAYDIALVRLETAINSTCITLNANKSLDVPGGNVTPVASGWGDLFDGANEGSLLLRSVALPLLPYSRCEEDEKDTAPRKDSRLCAGGVKGKDTCQGDSGGPLVMGADDKAMQIGTVAYGVGCGESPGVYTRVASYLKWMQSLKIPIKTTNKLL